MRLKKFIATNLQGASFSLQFGLVNVLCGSNFAGKTSVLKAIRLALTGSLPLPIGSRPGSIYKLAGDSEHAGSMSLRLETDGNRVIETSYTKHEDGTCSVDGGVPMDLQLPEMLCTPAKFFSMTSAERTATVFAACDVSKSGFGAETLKARLTEVQVSPVAVCELVLATVSAAADKVFVPGMTPQKACAQLLEALKTWQKAAKDRKDVAMGQFAAYRNSTVGVRPVDLTAQIAAKQAELQKAGSSNDVERGRAAQRVESVKYRLSMDVSIKGNYEDIIPKTIAAYDKDSAECKAKLKSLKKLVDIVPLNEKYKRQMKLRDDVSKLLATAQVDKVAQDDIIASVEKLKLCDKCRSTLTNAAKKSICELDVLIETHRKALQKTQNALELSHAATVNANTENNQLGSEKIRLLDLIEDNEHNAAYIQNLYDEYLAATAALQALPVSVDNSALKQEIGALLAKQASFVTYQNNLKARDTLEQTVLAETCRESVYKAVAKIVQEEQGKVMEYAFNEVLAVSRHFTDGLLNSPLEFHDGELGRRVSQADIDERKITAPVGSWISHETLSGTEVAISYAAFGVALCQHAPMKLVFIDDVIIEPARKLKVIHRLLELAKAGIIDQAFYADADSRDFTSKSVSKEINVITL